MSVEEDVMKIQKKLTMMTSEDGTVSLLIKNVTHLILSRSKKTLKY